MGINYPQQALLLKGRPLCCCLPSPLAGISSGFLELACSLSPSGALSTCCDSSFLITKYNKSGDFRQRTSAAGAQKWRVLDFIPFFFFLNALHQRKISLKEEDLSWSCRVNQEKEGLPDRGLVRTRGYLVMMELTSFCSSETAHSGQCWEMGLRSAHGGHSLLGRRIWTPPMSSRELVQLLSMEMAG